MPGQQAGGTAIGSPVRTRVAVVAMDQMENAERADLGAISAAGGAGVDTLSLQGDP